MIGSMAEIRTRDAVWNVALTLTYRKGESAKPGKVADMANVSESTARDCLNVMARTGWLERDTETASGRVRFLPAREGGPAALPG